MFYNGNQLFANVSITFFEAPYYWYEIFGHFQSQHYFYADSTVKFRISFKDASEIVFLLRCLELTEKKKRKEVYCVRILDAILFERCRIMGG